MSATKTIAGAFFVPAVHRYGGCAWEIFGSAWLISSRFANPRTVITHLFGDRRGSSSNSKAHRELNRLRQQYPCCVLATFCVGFYDDELEVA